MPKPAKNIWKLGVRTVRVLWIIYIHYYKMHFNTAEVLDRYVAMFPEDRIYHNDIKYCAYRLVDGQYIKRSNRSGVRKPTFYITIRKFGEIDFKALYYKAHQYYIEKNKPVPDKFRPRNFECRLLEDFNL